MGPRVVDPMQAVRAFEEGRDYHADDDIVREDAEVGLDGPEGKRRRIGGPGTEKL